MSLFDTINGDIKKAMLARDHARLEALRGIKKEFLEAKTAKGADGELTDETANKILAKMLKANMSGQVASLHLPIVENGYITMFISEGSNVRKFANSNDAIGEMVIKGKTMNEVEEEMDSLVKQIKIIIQ